MKLTCVECPMGCEIDVEVSDGKVLSVKGNTCPRGKAYAQNEVVCPRRVLTSSVRAKNGKMVSVKTDAPIKRADTFEIMEVLNTIVVDVPVKIGQVIKENITENINLVATSNLKA